MTSRKTEKPAEVDPWVALSEREQNRVVDHLHVTDPNQTTEALAEYAASLTAEQLTEILALPRSAAVRSSGRA